MGRVGMNRVAVVLLGNDSNLGRQFQRVLFILSSCPQSGSFKFRYYRFRFRFSFTVPILVPVAIPTASASTFLPLSSSFRIRCPMSL